MEDLQTQSRCEGSWAALSDEMQQALDVVEEAVSLSDANEDLDHVVSIRIWRGAGLVRTSYRVSM